MEYALKQTIHYICTYIIEEMINSGSVSGTKGIQINFLMSSIQTVMSTKYSHIKQYMRYFDVLEDTAKLLMLPLDVKLLKSKDVITSLTTRVMLGLLQEFQPDKYSPKPIPSSVIDWLKNNDDGKEFPSRNHLI